MNYQIMDQMKEYEPEFDQMLFYLPLSGSAFKKVYYDELLGRAVSKFVPADDLVVPYTATSLDDAEAIIHGIKMSENDLRKQQVGGFYTDIELGTAQDSVSDELKQKERELEGVTKSKDENLFTAPLLRWGRVSPEDIVTSYKYSESRRFQTLKEMYQNIDAAKTLGVPNYKIRSKISRRGLSKQVASDLMLGFYTPKKPSDFFKKRIGEINRDLNQKEGQSITNPYLEALPDIMDITNRNRRLSLLSDEIDMFSAEDLQPDVLLNNQTSSISNSNPVINSQITGTPISPNSFAQQANNNYNSLSTVDKINAFKQQR